MKELTKKEWQLLNVIESESTSIDLAESVLSEVLENYFDDIENWQMLPYAAHQIMNLLNVAHLLIHNCKEELYKAVNGFSTETVANGT